MWGGLARGLYRPPPPLGRDECPPIRAVFRLPEMSPRGLGLSGMVGNIDFVPPRLPFCRLASLFNTTKMSSLGQPGCPVAQVPKKCGSCNEK